MDIISFKVTAAFAMIAIGIGYLGGTVINYAWWYCNERFKNKQYVLQAIGLVHLLLFIGVIIQLFLLYLSV